MGDAVGAVTGVIGDVVGGGIRNMSNGIVGKAAVANQGNLDEQRQRDQGISTQYLNRGESLYNAAAQSLNNTNNQIGVANNAINNAQGINQGPDVRTALGLLQTQANGSAPSAAEGVLQHGTDQAIAQQSALANSGNLSQMIGGQKTAMDNAANLVQQSANQASQLRANQQALGQQQYANAAGQQATQAGTNAATANNLANIQGTVMANQLAGSAAQGNLATANAANAGQLAQQGAALEQGALSQTNQQQAQAAGGLANGLGGAISAVAPLAMAAFSDERLKKNVKSDTSYSDDDEQMKARRQIKEGFISSDENMKEDIKKDTKDKPKIQKFLEGIEPSTFEYKEQDGVMGRTPGEHMGVMAQDVEKAPGGKSMVIETPKGKAIDLASAMGTLMSAASDAHERIASLEELFKSRKMAGGKK